jgi:hypothetical protein
LRQRRRVIGAVADHRNELAVGLLFADICEFRLGCALSNEVIDTGFFCDGRGGERIVARYHDAAHTHPAQTLQALGEPGFQNIREYDYTDDIGAIGDDERRGALFANSFNYALEFRWNGAGLTLDEAYYCVRSAFADFATIRKIKTAHTRLSGKCNEPCAVRSGNVGRSSTTIEMEFDYSLSFGRLIRDRGERSEPSELCSGIFSDRQKISRVPVAHRDRAGFVEQHRIDITGGLNRFAALG